MGIALALFGDSESCSVATLAVSAHRLGFVCSVSPSEPEFPEGRFVAVIDGTVWFWAIKFGRCVRWDGYQCSAKKVQQLQEHWVLQLNTWNQFVVGIQAELRQKDGDADVQS